MPRIPDFDFRSTPEYRRGLLQLELNHERARDRRLGMAEVRVKMEAKSNVCGAWVHEDPYVEINKVIAKRQAWHRYSQSKRGKRKGGTK